MAPPSNTKLTTGMASLVGMREDLADYVSRIDPEEVPFFSFTGNARATNDLAHDWQTVSLREPAKNAQPEGNIWAPTAVKRTVRLTNSCQIVSEIAAVSRTANVVDKAGRDSELDFQVMLKSLEMRRDVEEALLSNRVKKLSDPRELAGIKTWAGTSDVGAGGTPPTADGATVVVPGSGRDLDLDLLNGTMHDAWIKGARVSLLMMHPTQKLIFDELPVGTNLAEAQVSVGSSSGIDWVTTVSLWKSTFGSVKVILNQWMSDSDVLGFDERDRFRPKKAPLPSSNFVRQTPQLNFDGRAESITWEGTLEVPNPNSVFLISGLNPTPAS